MAVASPVIPLKIPSFEGGLNLRDAPTELAPNESPNLWNVVIDERGGVVKRLGYSKWNAAAATNLVTYGYYSRVADKLLWYSPVDGKLYSDPGTGVLTLRRTWTTGSNITIADFAGSVYAVHPIDGLYSSADGVTWTAVTAASGSVPKGDLLAVWQNKIWVAGDINAKTRLYFSAPGDATKWATSDGGGFNDLREGRDGEAPIVALFGATGSDFQTNPSLLVFKNTSTHRVTDSSSAAYVTLDAANGAGGPNAVTTAYGRIYTVGTQGCFETDGQSPLIPISSKLDPLFAPGKINFALQSGFAAGAQQGRVYFSIARVNASNNDIVLEYHPLFKAFTVRSDAMRCYVPYTKSSDIFIGASPTVTGQMYSLNSGGTDDGTAIQSWFLTRVFEPLGGLESRMQKAQIRVAGTTNVQVLADYATSSSSTQVASGVSGAGFIWNTGVWGVDVWGDGGSPESFVVSWPRSFGKAFQFRFDETSSLTRAGNLLLDGTYQPTVGAWAIYGIDAALSQLTSI